MGGAGAFVKELQDGVLKDETLSLSAAVRFAVKEEEQRTEKRENINKDQEN